MQDMQPQIYEKLKFEIADALRAVSSHRWRNGTHGGNTLRELFARLAEDRFNVVVAGRFSRGKTSLMNAMFGKEYLPTGVIPLTSVITAIRYGSEPKAVLYYNHTDLFMDVKLWELPSHITERGNPGNMRNVRVAEVELPAEILRQGFRFVDTPGLGSSIAANTRTTERFLPEADALIVVSSYDSPLSEDEVRVIGQAIARDRRVFLVLNKRDLVGPDEQAEATRHVQDRLRDEFGARSPAIFPVSAVDALAAHIARDHKAFHASGLPDLTRALGRFLAGEQRRDFIRGMCDRVEELLREDGLLDLLVRLDGVRDTLNTGVPDTEEAGYEELTPFLAHCEICEHVYNTTFDRLTRLQTELLANETMRGSFASQGGLCRRHMRQLQRLMATHALAIASAAVADHWVAQLEEAAKTPEEAASDLAVATLLPDHGCCLVCDAVRPVEDQAIERLGRVAASDPALVHQRSALCLPHLAGLLRHVTDPAACRRLILAEIALLKRVSSEARGYALKHEAAERYAATKEELAAGVRLVRILGFSDS